MNNLVNKFEVFLVKNICFQFQYDFDLLARKDIEHKDKWVLSSDSANLKAGEKLGQHSTITCF